MQAKWKCDLSNLTPVSVLQGSIGDPGPVGYSGMKVKKKNVIISIGCL